MHVAPNSRRRLANGTPRALGQTDKAISHLALSPKGDVVLAPRRHHGVDAAVCGRAARRSSPPYDGKLVQVSWSPDGKHDRARRSPPRHRAGRRSRRQERPRAARSHRRALLGRSGAGTAAACSSAATTAPRACGRRRWQSSVRAARPRRRRRIARGSRPTSTGRDLEPRRQRAGVGRSSSPAARVLVEGAPIEELTLDSDRALVKTPTAVARWDLAPATARAAVLVGRGAAQPRARRAVARRRAACSCRARTGRSRCAAGTAPPIALRGHKNRDQPRRVLAATASSSTRRRSTARCAGGTTTTGTSTLAARRLRPGARLRARRRWPGRRPGRRRRHDDHARTAPPTTLGTGGSWCVTWAEFEQVRDRLIMYRCDRSVGDARRQAR